MPPGGDHNFSKLALYDSLRGLGIKVAVKGDDAAKG